MENQLRREIFWLHKCYIFILIPSAVSIIISFLYPLLILSPGKDAQAMNKQYSCKISELESEVEQARIELTEAQKQLQDLELQGGRDAADRSKAQECRRKIAAAQSKVQVCVFASPS